MLDCGRPRVYGELSDKMSLLPLRIDSCSRSCQFFVIFVIPTRGSSPVQSFASHLFLDVYVGISALLVGNGADVPASGSEIVIRVKNLEPLGCSVRPQWKTRQKTGHVRVRFRCGVGQSSKQRGLRDF